MEVRSSLAETPRRMLETIARDWIGLWCAPTDVAQFDRLHAPAFVDHASAGRGSGKSDFLDGLLAFTAAFPDLATTVDDLAIDAARGCVAVRWSAEGTSRGPFLGRPALHRRVRFTGIETIAVADGRIVERWGEWDASDLNSPAPATG